MARRKPTKTLRPKPARRKVRVHTTPKLTPAEFEKLEARAAAEMRSVANYVAFLVVQHMRGNGRRKLRPLRPARATIRLPTRSRFRSTRTRGPSLKPRRNVALVIAENLRAPR